MTGALSASSQAEGDGSDAQLAQGLAWEKYASAVTRSRDTVDDVYKAVDTRLDHRKGSSASKRVYRWADKNVAGQDGSRRACRHPSLNAACLHAIAAHGLRRTGQ